MSGSHQLRQEHLNHAFFEGISAAPMVNMTKARDMDVVEQMLRRRERGEHPSLISTTSRLPTSGGYGASTPTPSPPPPRIHTPAQQHSQLSIDPTQQDSASYTSPLRMQRQPSVHTMWDDGGQRTRASPQQQPTPSAFVAASPPPPPRQYTPSPSVQPRQPSAAYGGGGYTPGPSAFDMPRSVAPSPAGSLRSQRLAAERAAGSVAQRRSPASASSPSLARPSKFAELTQQHMDKLSAPAVAPVAAAAAGGYFGGAMVHAAPRRSSRLSAVESSVTHQHAAAAADRRRHRHHYHRRERSSSSSRSLSSDRRARNRKGSRAHRYDVTLALKELKVPFNETEDSLSDLEYILDRTLSAREKKKRIENARSSVNIVTSLLEMGVLQVFPSLKLKGWSNRLTTDLKSEAHEDTLAQLHTKIFGNGHGRGSIWISLVLILLGSAIAQAEANKAAGGNGGSTGGGGMLSSLFNMFVPTKQPAAAASAPKAAPKTAAVPASGKPGGRKRIAASGI